METKTNGAKTAAIIGIMCSIIYLPVYVSKNVLGVVSPQMLADGTLTTAAVGTLSSVYFVVYAIGQLVNGYIGEKLKVKFMVPIGLLLSGVFSVVFVLLRQEMMALFVSYGAIGFCLAMIYSPLVKVTSENMSLVYATRCNLGFTVASMLGSPLAGAIAMGFNWQMTFYTSAGILIVMAVVCYVFFDRFEKKGYIRYGQYDDKRKGGKEGIKTLIKCQIIRYTGVSMLTGVVRTSVVFWLPTFFNQYIGLSAEKSVLYFTIASLVISVSAFLSITVYELIGRKMEITMLLFFTMATVSFLGAYLCGARYISIWLIVLAVIGSNAASDMMWSRYCPGLRETGMVATATGYLDFMSYIAAAISSTLFANAVDGIGWSWLILIWAALMLCGALISLPYRKRNANL